MYGFCHDEVVHVYWEMEFSSLNCIDTSVLEFGWGSKQAVVISMIAIGVSDSNLLAGEFDMSIDEDQNEDVFVWAGGCQLEEDGCFG